MLEPFWITTDLGLSLEKQYWTKSTSTGAFASCGKRLSNADC